MSLSVLRKLSPAPGERSMEGKETTRSSNPTQQKEPGLEIKSTGEVKADHLKVQVMQPFRSAH